MDYFLKTDRIKFRRFQESDLNSLYRLDSNAEVVKYISDGKPFNRKQIQENLNLIISKYQNWGKYGLWAAELNPDSTFIGWFSLKPLPKINDIEVGYRLLPEYWGQGLATEGAQAMFQYGLQKCQLEKVVAITHPENIASQKVLLKCGLKQNGTIPNPFSNEKVPSDVLYFELNR